MNKFQLHLFLFLKIPISWIAGVRLKEMNDEICITKVKFGWLNQNPFNSMFWAVQGMAAEFSTGFLCAEKIRKSGKKISMLVVHNQAEFTKKAVGRVTFSSTVSKYFLINWVFPTRLAPNKTSTLLGLRLFLKLSSTALFT